MRHMEEQNHPNAESPSLAAGRSFAMPSAAWASVVHDGRCAQCSAPLEQACALTVELRAGDKLIVRTRIFDLHPTCAERVAKMQRTVMHATWGHNTDAVISWTLTERSAAKLQ